MTRVRGAALAETAIVVSFTLLVIFGAIQIALVGFVQTQLDGATFMYSHEVSLGSSNSADIDAALGPIFPSLPLTGWSPASNTMDGNPLSTDTTQMPNWTQWGSQSERFGGASILRDQLVQTKGTMTLNGLSALGNSITLSAGNVEGKEMVGNHDDDVQGANFNSSTVYSSLVNPITQDDQNVPPYYFNFAFIFYCTHAQFAAGTCAGTYGTSGGLRAVGLAEYLKDDQTGNAGNYNTSADGIGTNGTFQTVACHQRIYADLAAAFPAVMPSPSPIPGSDYDETSTGPATVAAWNGASFQMVYAWDVQGMHGENPGSKTFANGFPLDPIFGCSDGGPGS
jgi:hypothetical protein